MWRWSIILIIIALTITVPNGYAVEFDDELTSDQEKTFEKILDPVMKLYDLARYIASAVAGIMLVIAGINYMLSGNDPQKRENSKKTATYVVLGLIMIWSAPYLVNYLI